MQAFAHYIAERVMILALATAAAEQQQQATRVTLADGAPMSRAWSACYATTSTRRLQERVSL